MGEVVRIPEPPRSRPPHPVSVFGRDLSPSVIRFFLNHWLEIVALGDGEDGEEAVRDLREALRYEFDHLKPGRVPCRCGELTYPKAAAGGGGSVGGRSFSVLVPSIEIAYEELPIGWRGRTKVYLLMLGHSEQSIYEMRQRPERGSMSPFDIYHLQRIRSEIRRPSFRTRPQDSEAETESPFRRMAAALGWRPAGVDPRLSLDQVAAAA